jgi:membrane protein YdbS with pleckstrin-like domain
VSWRSLVAAVLRVPPEPQAPPGHVHRTFRAGRNYLRYKLVKWGGKQLATMFGLVAAGEIIPKIELAMVARVLLILEATGWVLFFAAIPFSLAVVLLDFEMRWYMMTDRSLRIREGIFIVREKTMTFANIQKTTVRQGPLQRFLGIADVEVRSAGGGAGKGHEDEEGRHLVHVGHFRGVDQAERIRDLVLEGVRRQRDAGLGDPDDHAPQSIGGGGEPAAALAEAAAAFLSEARLLRETVAGKAR